MTEKFLAIFSAPKPFKEGHIITIQRNAVRSWMALGDQVDVLLLGDDEGIDRHAADLGARHVKNIRCNQYGTPLISSMLQTAREQSAAPYLMLINTDIILFPDIVDGVHAARQVLDDFLLIGQRWDMDVREELHLDAEQAAQFKNSVHRKGRLHPPMGSDYFIFPRTCYPEIPDMAIGRAGWDNWFIYKSRWEGWPVVDATHDITIVHQNHDYRHLPGGQPHYRLPETAENVRLGGGEHTIFTIFDAQFLLVNGRITRRKPTLQKILRELEIFPLAHRRSDALGKLIFYLLRPRKAYWKFRGKIREMVHRDRSGAGG